jgi:hypothetical protein
VPTLSLLKAVYMPHQLAVIRCKRDHKGADIIAAVNKLAHQPAQKLALGPFLSIRALISTLLASPCNPLPKYLQLKTLDVSWSSQTH